mmetsp:Transcript_12070/g.24954  ORF Transcript_12070/g.24954 Transcript_12070/m.24954 type:complete len:107 (+) Transcript_12070:74-394(+)
MGRGRRRVRGGGRGGEVKQKFFMSAFDTRVSGSTGLVDFVEQDSKDSYRLHFELRNYMSFSFVEKQNYGSRRESICLVRAKFVMSRFSSFSSDRSTCVLGLAVLCR